MANDGRIERSLQIAASPAVVFSYFTDPHRLVRWSGLALLLAGLFLVLQQGFALASPDPTTSGWVAAHTLGYFGLVLGLLGLVGAHSIQQDRFTRAGTIGFILAFIGSGLTGGAAFLATYIVPVLTVEAPDLLGGGPKRGASSLDQSDRGSEAYKKEKRPKGRFFASEGCPRKRQSLF